MSEKQEPSSESAELSDVVAENLKRYRAERGLSLTELAHRSGVSRAMIHQIERRQSAPTINVVWKLATALSLPFAALLEGSLGEETVLVPKARRWAVASADGRFVSRALFPLDGAHRGAEMYELTLQPGADEKADPHAAGTKENLAIAQGELTVWVEDKAYALSEGDAILFSADVPHRYENRSELPVKAFLMMTYGER